MSRISRDQYIDDRLINGYDYVNQSWVLNGRYVDCGHPVEMKCNCYGRAHKGEKTLKGLLDGTIR